MNEYVDWLLANHRQSGILIDSNILLLLLIGTHDVDHIPRFRRTSHYLPEDFTLANNVLRRFERVITLHSILTEVSNLSGQLTGTRRTDCFSLLGMWIHTFHEHQIPGRDVADHILFPRLGLTDTAIIHVAQEGYLVFTDDFPLTGYLESAELPVLNFNYLREDSWRS